MSTGKANGYLARYFPNILLVTRQVQIAAKYLEKLMQA